MVRLLVCIVTAFVITITTADAKRPKVRIHKPSPPYATTQPIPAYAVVPVAVAFDIIRRTSCDPMIAVSTGPGDPGFDPKGPKTGNFLIPAIYRSECLAQPRR